MTDQRTVIFCAGRDHQKQGESVQVPPISQMYWCTVHDDCIAAYFELRKSHQMRRLNALFLGFLPFAIGWYVGARPGLVWIFIPVMVVVFLGVEWLQDKADGLTLLC